MRRAGLAVLISATVLLSCSRPASRLVLEPPTKPIVADGESHIYLSVRAVDGRVLSPVQVSARVIEQNGRGQILGVLSKSPGGTLALEFAPGVIAGPVTIELSGKELIPSRATVTTLPVISDYYKDGTPDFLRLASPGDRDAFRRWFTVLAERQSLPRTKLPAEINDCAALLRYAYREALRRHDSAWAADANFGALPAGSDVGKYSFPYTPMGPHIFRVREGSFAAPDIDNGTFAEFADAKTLIVANAHRISRDVRVAKPGDLLFYRQFEQNSPFHSMVFVGRSVFGEGNDLVVYHTGPTGKKSGEMRRASLTELLQHPNARWRPVVGNPNFLGVYRWNILREAE